MWKNARILQQVHELHNLSHIFQDFTGHGKGIYLYDFVMIYYPTQHASYDEFHGRNGRRTWQAT